MTVFDKGSSRIEDHDTAKSGCAFAINFPGSFSGTLGIDRASSEGNGEDIVVLVTPVYSIDGACENVSWFENWSSMTPHASQKND